MLEQIQVRETGRDKAEKELRESEEAIRNIAAGVSAQTGEAFFKSLSVHLAKIFAAEYTFIGLLDEQTPNTVNTIALCVRGEIVDNLSYELAATPCEHVVGGTCDVIRAYPRDIQRLFPEDQMLIEIGAQSYIGAPLADTNGKPIGLIVVMDNKPMENTGQVENILEIFAARAAAEIERLRAGEVLARSKAEFEAMFNAIPDAVMFADTERRIVMNNPAVQEMFGYSDQELLGRTTEMLYADRNDFIEQGSRRYRVESGAEQGPYEVKYKRKNGDVFWTETLGTQVKDTNGAAIGFIGLFRDITERKLAKEALKQAEEKYRSIFENAAEGIFQSTIDGRYQIANPMLAQILGYDSPEELMETLTDFEKQFYVQPSRRAEFMRLLQEQASYPASNHKSFARTAVRSGFQKTQESFATPAVRCGHYSSSSSMPMLHNF